MNAVLSFIKKYRHAWTLLYFFIYMTWFLLLEEYVTTYHVVYSPLDDYIPFCEYFIIPYFLWFLYVPLVVGFLLFNSKEDFYKTSAFLFIGMSICLLICTIWPNGQNLRVDINPDKNIFCAIISVLYKTDTHTNVFPSIHVFNSIAVHIAVTKNETLKKYKVIQYSSAILMVLICMATVFLKQHSVLDIVGGVALAMIMYCFVYRFDYSRVASFLRYHLQKTPV
ncbi:MAG: phosphatase PAP2 family protein [Lachnospiraceae bacterium]|nr:phosphatase PAP2 family protein [Lachnospiraceae bacterium]